MKVYLGADHRGFNLKEILKKWLYKDGHNVVDCGNEVYDQKDDYPDFTFSVAENVTKDKSSLGVVFCGSGGGVTIAANKVKGVLCAQALNVEDVVHNRDHNNINVLAIGSDFTHEVEAKEMVSAFLNTEFGKQPRFIRRLKKIAEREK
jgi:ribose 5-phosphate isomerase B